jgi:hypothetical protein
MKPARYLLLLFAFIFTTPGIGQNARAKKQFREDSIRITKPKLIRPQFRLDDRFTFLNKQRISITGLDAGVLLKNKLRVTLGYYSASDRLTSLTYTLNSVAYQGAYDLKYGALNLEFIYKNTRFFSLGMPLEFGFGGNSLVYQSKLDNSFTEKQSGFIAMSYFGLSGTFKPLRWIGLKAAFGYRKTLFNQVKNLAFDGFYTSVGIAVDFQEIITDVRMFKLKRKYRKDANQLETAVDLITD